MTPLCRTPGSGWDPSLRLYIMIPEGPLIMGSEGPSATNCEGESEKKDKVERMTGKRQGNVLKYNLIALRNSPDSVIFANKAMD